MKKKELKIDPKAELGRMKKLGEDFKKFISRGNVVDMAVGVVVGGAFSKIVTSLVNDLITPAIGVLLGGLDFSELSFGLKDAQINYGLFIQTIIDFLIIAACIFVVVKIFEKLKKKEEPKEEVKPEEPKKPDDILLLEEIRDLLKKKAK